MGIPAWLHLRSLQVETVGYYSHLAAAKATAWLLHSPVVVMVCRRAEQLPEAGAAGPGQVPRPQLCWVGRAGSPEDQAGVSGGWQAQQACSALPQVWCAYASQLTALHDTATAPAALGMCRAEPEWLPR